MQKFQGQRVNQNHSRDPNHSSDNTGSLTCYTTGELLPSLHTRKFNSPAAEMFYKLLIYYHYDKMLLNNQWITEEIKEKIRKYLEANENKEQIGDYQRERRFGGG